MTQSKKSDDTFTIDLSDTYGTTTSYWAGDSVTDVVYSGVNDGTFTITASSDSTLSLDASDTIDISWAYNNTSIDPSEVERMCNHYPALEKVWRNFKSVYDMVKQDYQGKKKAGEIDNEDFPF